MAKMSFRHFLLWNRNAFAFEHILMMLIGAAWLLISLLLAGCTTSSVAMSNIYIFSISYHVSSKPNDSTASLFSQAALGGKTALRAGYFGLCAKQSHETLWFCGSTTSIIRSYSRDGGLDPLNVVDLASSFRDDVLFPGLLITAIALTALAFGCLTTFPRWHKDVDARTGSDIDIKAFPSKSVSKSCLACLSLASVLLLCSALWQHSAAAAASSVITSTTQGHLKASVGPCAAALVWIAFVLTITACIFMLMQVLSVALMDRLTDD